MYPLLSLVAFYVMNYAILNDALKINFSYTVCFHEILKRNVFVFSADQTPTPTRFIRNCEEVGLFQDLQNENPFEETFRRAVEDGKSGVLTVPVVNIY